MNTFFQFALSMLISGSSRKVWLSSDMTFGDHLLFLIYGVLPHSLVTLFVLVSFPWLFWLPLVPTTKRWQTFYQILPAPYCHFSHCGYPQGKADKKKGGNSLPSSNLLPISDLSKIYIPLFSLQSHQTLLLLLFLFRVHSYCLKEDFSGFWSYINHFRFMMECCWARPTLWLGR